MRRLLRTSLLALLCIGLLSVGVGWWLIADGTWIRAKIEEVVTANTGRPFSINGVFELDLGSDPSLTMTALRLGNAPWARTSDMVSVDRLAVSINLMSVLSKQPVVHFIEVDGIELWLAENDTGETNWDLFPDRGEAEKEPMTELPLVLERLEINDLRLNLESPLRPEPLDLTLSRFLLQLVADQSVTITSSGALDGLPLTLDGRIDGLRAFAIGGALRNELRLGVGEITLNTRGSVEEVRGWQGIDLEVGLSGPEFAWILEQAALPVFSSGPFDFELAVKRQEGAARIELDGDLGSLQVYADGHLDDLFAPTDGSVDFMVRGPDLRTLGEVFGVTNLVSAPYELDGALGMSGGRLELNQLVFGFGEDRARLSGSIGAWPALTDTEVDLRCEGPDISVWGPALGIEGLQQRPFELNARFSNLESEAIATDSELSVGPHRLAVAGSLGTPPEFTDAAVDIDVSIADLGSIALLPGYENLPNEALTATGGVQRSGDGLRFDQLRVDMGDDRVVLDGTLALTEDFVGSDLRATVDLASLGRRAALFSVEGLPDLPLSLSAAVQDVDTGLEFQVTDASLGSLDFGLEGSLPELKSLDGAETTFQLSMPSLRVLSTLAPMDASTLPDRPLSIDGTLEYQDQAIDLRGISGQLGGAGFEIEGRVSGWPEMTGSQVRFSVDAPDVHELVSHEILDALPASFSARGTVSKAERQYRFEAVHLSLGGTTARLDGTVNELPGDSAMDLTLSVSGQDLSEFEGIANQELPDWDFEMAADIEGWSEALKIDGLSLRLGPSDVAGALQLSLAGRKSISGQLRSKLIDLSWLEKRAADDAPDDDAEASGATRDVVFPKTPLPARIENPLELDLLVSVDQLWTPTSELEAIEVGIYRDASIIRLNPLQVRGQQGGTLRGNIEMDWSPRLPRMTFGLEGTDVRIGLATAEGQDPATFPPWDIAIQMHGEGESQHDIAASMSGQIRIVTGKGKVANAGLGFIMSDLLSELFNLLNPFATKAEFTNLDCGVVALDVEEGVMKTIVPVVIQTEELSILSGGTIDLGAETLDLGFKTRVRKGLGISASTVVNPFIKLGGELSSPVIELDAKGSAVAGSMAVATAGLSVIARALYDRFIDSRDLCSETVKQIEKVEAGQAGSRP